MYCPVIVNQHFPYHLGVDIFSIYIQSFHAQLQMQLSYLGDRLSTQGTLAYGVLKFFVYCKDFFLNEYKIITMVPVILLSS